MTNHLISTVVFPGTESSLEERDWTINLSILSGDILGDDIDNDFTQFKEDNARHVLTVSNLTGITIINGLVIKNGNTRSGDIPPNTTDLTPWAGGGLFLLNAKAEVRNCVFQQSSGRTGTAFYMRSDGTGSTEVLLEDNTFENNASRNGNLRIENSNSPIIRNCTFTSNTSESLGGAISLGNTSAQIDDCIFQSNSTPDIIRWSNLHLSKFC